MRQAQSNRRGRGRSRKAQNPLTKNYESNGPDVKIRGTAAHISEKYNSLARDAQTSGDTVRQENYFQHAEHYNRIIAAAQQNNQTNSEKSDEQTAEQNSSDEAEQQATNGRARGENGRSDGRKNNRRRRQDNRSQRTNGDASEETKQAVTAEDDSNDATAVEKPEKKPRGRGRRRSETQVEVIASEETEQPAAETPPSESPVVENNADDAAA